MCEITHIWSFNSKSTQIQHPTCMYVIPDNKRRERNAQLFEGSSIWCHVLIWQQCMLMKTNIYIYTWFELDVILILNCYLYVVGILRFHIFMYLSFQGMSHVWRNWYRYLNRFGIKEGRWRQQISFPSTPNHLVSSLSWSFSLISHPFSYVSRPWQAVCSANAGKWLLVDSTENFDC